MNKDTNHKLACDKVDNQTASREHIVIKDAKSYTKQQNKRSIMKIKIYDKPPFRRKSTDKLPDNIKN